MNHDFKVFGVRGGLIGDSVAALPVYQFVRKIKPNSFLYWQISRKCAQAVPLFYNHPLINQLVISDCNEGVGPNDFKLMSKCSLIFNVMPQHPEGDNWPNIRDVYHETFRMAGLNDEQYNQLTNDEKLPYLNLWFDLKRNQKSIALWPGARQGEKQKRIPDWEFYHALCLRLKKEGFKIYQCGHPNDFKDYPSLGYDIRQLSFIELIKWSLECDLAIGTDSGSMIALAAYHHIPTISLLCNHWPGHIQNPTAFGPKGKKHINLFSPTNNGHDINKIVELIKDITS